MPFESSLADPQDRPPSPYVNVCSLDARGYCSGCLRTGTEIGQWTSMSPAEQWRLLAELEQRRVLIGALRAAK